MVDYAYHICYHNDEDGLASASIIYEYLKILTRRTRKNVGYYFHEIDYTVDLSEILNNIQTGDEIFFVDYSFSNKDNLEFAFELCGDGHHITWIDHHKTSLDLINNNPYEDINFGRYDYFDHLIDTNYCGAYLAYKYAYYKLNYNMTMREINYSMYPNNVPLYIKYVNSWDTWAHDMPNTVEFNTGIRSFHRTPRNVFGSIFKYSRNITNKLFSTKEDDIKITESYMKEYIDKVIENGKIIKTYDDNINKSLCDQYGFEFNIMLGSAMDIEVLHCFALNKRGNSMMFGNKVDKYDIVVPFMFNGGKYVYSLYTNKDYVDCEWLAKVLGTIDNLGGGGHTQASGFQTYDQILRTNCSIYITNKIFNKNKYRILIK